MDITGYYVGIMEVIKPCLVLGGMLSLTISIIVALINMMIDAFIGKGLHIGSR